ncbi:MAG: hypothetical protein MZV49_03115 [Rhodopseudomonas palustris]|nr:hypothetical protein [Rhodopseudomonas palustris]
MDDIRFPPRRDGKQDVKAGLSRTRNNDRIISAAGWRCIAATPPTDDLLMSGDVLA